MKIGRTSRGVAIAAALSVGLLALSACSSSSGGGSNGAPSDKKVTITYLVDNGDTSVPTTKALVDAFVAANPNITVTVDTRPGGADGDNLIKTKLATGDMADVFFYNSGALLQALDPQKNLVPLTDQSFQANVDAGFKAAVTFNGQVYGAPLGTAMGGGILYNKPIYDQLGLQIPKTWADFQANNAKIKAAGIAPVIQSYGDTWTSQLLILADYHNVAAANPDWAQQYTANDPNAKYTKDPALPGFQRLQDLHASGYMNDNFASMKLAQAEAALAAGKGAQYPMLTFALADLIKIDPKMSTDIGFFGQPGADAATNGMTLWEPNSLYIPNTTEGDKLDAAKKFVAFVASPAGCAAITAAVPPTGPYVVKGCTLPADVAFAVTQMQAYVDAGTSTPALEFLSPVKGPNLEKITVEVGSGIRDAASGAALYDEDVKKQAQQLGLPGW